MNTKLLLTFLASTALAFPAAAQSRLVSLTAGNTPTVVQQDTGGNCATVHRCAPQGFPQVQNRAAGGTAYDPRTGGVWISDGKMLAKVDPETCDYQCRPVPAPIANDAFVTGLAMQESENRLFIVDSLGNITSLIVRGCQFVAAGSRCRINVPLPAAQSFSGLAVDEARGLILYSASDFTGTSLSQAIYVARAGDPCNPFCAARITNCPNSAARLGGITGLAFDPCKSELWATDGANVVAAHFTLSPLAGCSLSNFRCCGGPSTTVLGAAGLDLLPEGARSVGRSCTDGACGNCARMEHGILGGPTIGNPDFRLVLDNAPTGARAWLVINAGTCQTPGVQVRGFCGPILVPRHPIPPVVIGPFPTGGTGGTACTGSVSAHVPIPLSLALCGGPFVSQFVVLCLNSPLGIGTGVSNCSEFTIQGS